VAKDQRVNEGRQPNRYVLTSSSNKNTPENELLKAQYHLVPISSVRKVRIYDWAQTFAIFCITDILAEACTLPEDRAVRLRF